MIQAEVNCATLRNIYTGISNDTDFLKGILRTLNDSGIFDDDTANKLHNVFLDIDKWLALVLLVSQTGCRQNALRNETWVPAHGPLVDEDVVEEVRYADTLNAQDSDRCLDTGDTTELRNSVTCDQVPLFDFFNSNKMVKEEIVDPAGSSDLFSNECDGGQTYIQPEELNSIKIDFEYNEFDQNSHESERANDESSFSNSTVATKQEGTRKRIKFYICYICNQHHQSMKALRKHLKKYHPIGPSCQFCYKTFRQISHLNFHLKTHSDKMPFNCYICGSAFHHATAFKIHFRIHPGHKPFKCDACGKTYTQYASLQEHSIIHSGEKPFKCEICGKASYRLNFMEVHRKIHTGERQFKCDICGKAYIQHWHLKEHIRSHTGERRFKCEVCGKAFARHGHLNEHLRIHAIEKPYKCSICGKTFTRSSHLKLHSKTHSHYEIYFQNAPLT